MLDNPALILVFNRLNRIRILTDDRNIPSKYGLKFVERLPSLTIVEMEVYSIDISTSIVDIFPSELAKVRFIVI